MNIWEEWQRAPGRIIWLAFADLEDGLHQDKLVHTSQTTADTSGRAMLTTAGLVW